jgi:CRP-like cAMP-binding protein
MSIMGLQDKRSASAKTLVETTILELTSEAFEALIRRSPELAMSVIKSLCERVRDANIKVSAFAHKSDSARISALVAIQAEEKGQNLQSPTPGKILQVKPEFIAASLGVNVKLVQDYFEIAQQARMIGRYGDWIWVPYPNYLVPFGEFVSDRLTGG